MLRMELIASLKTGITRLRTKGGASPQALYDLVNGFVDASGAPTSRPGVSQMHVTPAGTKGCTTFNGKIVVFANEVIDPGDARFECLVLRHPTDPTALLRTIHFAGPIAGALFVTAEFDDGEVFDYWMESADTWEAETVYFQNGLVQPTVPNGFVYRATRLDEPRLAWAAGVARTVGDEIEPTTYNGYWYECVDTLGNNPASGQTEPTWPTDDGAQVIEETSATATPSNPNPPTGGVPPTGGTVPPRYENIAGQSSRESRIER